MKTLFGEVLRKSYEFSKEGYPNPVSWIFTVNM